MKSLGEGDNKDNLGQTDKNVPKSSRQQVTVKKFIWLNAATTFSIEGLFATLSIECYAECSNYFDVLLTCHTNDIL